MVPDPRQSCQPGLPPEDQVAQGATGQVGGADAVTDVAAGPRESGGPVEPDGGAPVAGDAERASPAVGDLHIPQDGEEVDQRGAEVSEDGCVAAEVARDLCAVAVGSATTAEHEPVVGGALAIDDQVPVVGEGLAPPQADLVPLLGGERRRGEHQRVHWGQRPQVSGQRRGVSLDGSHHHVGADRAAIGVDRVRGQRECPGLLVDGDPTSLDSVGQASHQLGWVDCGAVWGVCRPEGTVAPQDLPGRRLIEQDHALVVPGLRLRDFGPGTGQLDLGAGEGDGAALDDVGLDALAGRGGDHLIDALSHGPSLCQRSVSTSQLCQGRRRGREEGRAPASVAPRCAVPRDLGVQDDDAQPGLGRCEVVGGPQPGVARADDGDVRRRVLGQRGSRGPIGLGGLVPEGQPGVAAQRTPHE